MLRVSGPGAIPENSVVVSGGCREGLQAAVQDDHGLVFVGNSRDAWTAAQVRHVRMPSLADAPAHAADLATGHAQGARGPGCEAVELLPEAGGCGAHEIQKAVTAVDARPAIDGKVQEVNALQKARVFKKLHEHSSSEAIWNVPDHNGRAITTPERITGNARPATFFSNRRRVRG